MYSAGECLPSVGKVPRFDSPAPQRTSTNVSLTDLLRPDPTHLPGLCPPQILSLLAVLLSYWPAFLSCWLQGLCPTVASAQEVASSFRLLTGWITLIVKCQLVTQLMNGPQLPLPAAHAYMCPSHYQII